MARCRRRYRIVCRRLQTAAALGIVAGLLSTAQPSAAGASGSIRLSGHVAPHAAVRLSNWTITPAPSRRSMRGLRLGLTDLSLLANTRKFTISLMPARGRPSLVDPATGSTVPYEVSYGGTGLVPVDGEIRLDRLLRSATGDSGAKGLEVRLRPGATLGSSGRYQDRLVLVIKAR